MVPAGISGLETHQIFTQGAPPPHPWHCLSATMSNCFLFARLLPGRQIWRKTCALKHKLMYLPLLRKQPWLDLTRGGAHSFIMWLLVLTWAVLFCFFCFFFQSGSCLRIRPRPARPGPAFFRSVVSHMSSTCRLVENLN